MKKNLALMALTGCGIMAYYLIPVFAIHTLPSCVYSTTLITTKKNGHVVASGEYFTRSHGTNLVGSYNGRLFYYDNNYNLINDKKINVTFEQERHIKSGFIETRNTDFTEIFGNTVDRQDGYRYVFPNFRTDAVSNYRIITINDELQSLSIVRNDPRIICTRRL